jgi:hypothetical protein
MKRDRSKRLLPALALFCALTAAAPTRPAPRPPAPCEGDACQDVTLTFDEARGQYLARNNSADRWARVTASNLASSSTACLAPGKDDYLVLKSVVGAYRADYSEPKCGGQGGGR